MTPLEQFSMALDRVFGVTTSKVASSGYRITCSDCGREVLEATVLHTDEMHLCKDCVMDRLFTESGDEPDWREEIPTDADRNGGASAFNARFSS